MATKSGAAITLGDAAVGMIAGAKLPPGPFDPAKKRGWRMKKAGAVWRYVDNTAKSAGRDPADGAHRRWRRRDGAITRVGAGEGSRGLVCRGRPAEATVALGEDGGTCFTASFPGAPGPKCEVKAAGATLRCR